MKDKSRATDQDVFGLTKLLFGTTDQPYTSRSDTGATLLAAAEPLPAARGDPAGGHAASGRSSTARTWARRSTSTSRSPPTRRRRCRASSYDDPDAIPFWWERGALTAWQTVPATLATIDEHDLFETELFQPFKPLVDIAGGDPDRRPAARLPAALHDQHRRAQRGRHGHLAQPRTPCCRAPRTTGPGCFGNQYHAWQATLDEDAVVFTTLPGNEPRPGTAGSTPTSTGPAPAPCRGSAQQGAAAIHLYAPALRRRRARARSRRSSTCRTRTPTSRPSGSTRCARSATGRSGRRGDGYVALWSWRPTTWRTHDPAVTLHERADPAVRPGRRRAGADNVWIVRGRRRRHVGLVRRLRRRRDLGPPVSVRPVRRVPTACRAGSTCVRRPRHRGRSRSAVGPVHGSAPTCRCTAPPGSTTRSARRVRGATVDIAEAGASPSTPSRGPGPPRSATAGRHTVNGRGREPVDHQPIGAPARTI